jgi:hypothetical protein
MDDILLLILVTVSKSGSHLSAPSAIDPDNTRGAPSLEFGVRPSRSLHREAVAFPLTRPPAAYRLTALIKALHSGASDLYHDCSGFTGAPCSKRPPAIGFIELPSYVNLLLDSKVTVLASCHSPQLQPNFRCRLYNSRHIRISIDRYPTDGKARGWRRWLAFLPSGLDRRVGPRTRWESLGSGLVGGERRARFHVS